MKLLDLTAQQRQEAIASFTKYALETKDADINFKYCVTPKEKQKAMVCFTAEAYLKMFALVDASQKEIGWYGLVSKIDTTVYLIQDIIVYPQKVAPATVEQDEAREALWFMSLPDNVINNIRFQGHSHVHMGVSPSGQDDANRLEFLTQIKENEFFIFAIANKSNKLNLWVYDRAQHIIYEPTDIDCYIVDEKGNTLQSWAQDEIKNQIIDKTYYSAPKATNIQTAIADVSPVYPEYKGYDIYDDTDTDGMYNNGARDIYDNTYSTSRNNIKPNKAKDKKDRFIEERDRRKGARKK